MGTVPLRDEVYHHGPEVGIAAESIQTVRTKSKKADCPQGLNRACVCVYDGHPVSERDRHNCIEPIPDCAVEFARIDVIKFNQIPAHL